jgi:hypothetical protein
MVRQISTAEEGDTEETQVKLRVGIVVFAVSSKEAAGIRLFP